MANQTRLEQTALSFGSIDGSVAYTRVDAALNTFAFSGTDISTPVSVSGFDNVDAVAFVATASDGTKRARISAPSFDTITFEGAVPANRVSIRGVDDVEVGTDFQLRQTGSHLELYNTSTTAIVKLDEAISNSEKGASNGIATLDASGFVPISQLSITPTTFLGAWNASTNTPIIVSSVGSAWDTYEITVSGTTNIDGNSIWNVGDRITFDGTTWVRFPFAGVSSVAGKEGDVTLQLGTDITDIAITNKAPNQVLGVNTANGNWVNKNIVASGSRVAIAHSDTAISVSTTAELNTASNVGAGQAGVFRSKTGENLAFRTIQQGTGILVTQGTDEVSVRVRGTAGSVQTAGPFSSVGTTIQAIPGIQVTFTESAAFLVTLSCLCLSSGNSDPQAGISLFLNGSEVAYTRRISDYFTNASRGESLHTQMYHVATPDDVISGRFVSSTGTLTVQNISFVWLPVAA